MYFLKFISVITKIILIQNILFFSNTYSEELFLKSNNLSPNSDYLKNKNKDQFYILGAGDRLYIEVNKLSKDINGIFTIDANGLLNLKRLKEIYVEGLTKDELINLLNEEYKSYVKSPDVNIIILQYRVVKVYVDGEVNNPGLYVLPGSFKSFPLQNNLKQNFLSKDPNNNVNILPQEISTPTYSIEDDQILIDNNYFPTLIDFLRVSGGVTLNSDLENIKIVRKNSISKGGGKIKTEVDLLKTLVDNDISQNIRIYDGDSISIPKSDKQILSQVSKAIKSNINPRYINIFVGGEVQNPGVIKANKMSVLVDAIDTAGGPKVLKGPVRFVRYSIDGKVDRRQFNLNRRAKNGSYKNPYLKDGDLIFIGKSGFSVASEVVTEITSPFQGLFSAYGLYKAITD